MVRFMKKVINNPDTELDGATVVTDDSVRKVTLRPQIVVSEPYDIEHWELIEFTYDQDVVTGKKELTAEDCTLGLIDRRMEIVKTVPATSTEVPVHHAVASVFRANLCVCKVETLIADD